jgi:hypothetical protein
MEKASSLQLKYEMQIMSGLEAVVTCFKVIFQKLSSGIKEMHLHSTSFLSLFLYDPIVKTYSIFLDVTCCSRFFLLNYICILRAVTSQGYSCCLQS